MALPFTEAQRRRAFEALVLQGIWLVLLAVARGPRITDWRADAITYLDAIDEDGGDREARKLHRREKLPEPPRLT